MTLQSAVLPSFKTPGFSNWLPWPSSFLLGVCLQLQQAALGDKALNQAIALIAAAVIALGFFLIKPGLWRLLSVGIALVALGFAQTAWRAHVKAAQALNPVLQGLDIDVVGTVVAMPQKHPAGLRFRLAVESATLKGGSVTLPPLVDLGWYAGFSLAPRVDTAPAVAELQRQTADLRAGERYALRVRLKQPHGQRNPGGFDYELWLWEQGVAASGYVRATARDPAPQRLAPAAWQPMYAIERARQSTRDAIMARVPDQRAAGVMAALVVGDQRAIERADWDVFRATGVAHLMSISGLHVTMFAWLAGGIVGWLWRRSARYTPRFCNAVPSPTAAAVGGVLLAYLYALFSGFGVPAQRTVLMLLAVLLLRLAGLRWPWPLVWLTAAVAVTLFDPWALMQPGFWLSFVAVGVLMGSGGTSESLSKSIATDTMDTGKTGQYGIKKRVLMAFRAMSAEQWRISLALAPLSLVLFGQMSLVGLLANMLAIPWVTFVVTPLAMLGSVLPIAWDLGALCVQALHALLVWCAALPYAVAQVAVAPLALGLLACVGGVWFAVPGPWWQRCLALPWVLPVLLWQAPRPEVGQFEVLALDVGQGSAVVVRTATRTLLVDAGPAYSVEADAGQRVVLPYLRFRNEPLHELMLTHRDIDHTGGAKALLQAFPQAAMRSSLEVDHPLVKQPGLQHTRCAAGQNWVWDGVRFEVLHPRADDYNYAQKTNAMSCVLRVANGVKTALLTGDIEAAQEAELVDLQRQSLKADLLLVPHHGSQTSSTKAFLDAVAPRFALVQSGYRNRFGHPTAGVMQRYAEGNVVVLTSPQCGAASWQSSKPDMVTCERQRTQRYWHWKP